MNGVSSSIQFRGLSNVLKAYEERGVEAWSLWQGKQFMTKGNDGDTLRTFLEALDQSGSTAVYRLQVYEDISDIKEIKSTTPHDGSFNFRLWDRESAEFEGFQHAGRYGGGRSVELEKRFDELEERIGAFLEAKEKEREEEEEPKGVMGTVIGLLQDPDKLEKLITLGKSLLGQPVQPAYVGNVNRAQDMASLSPSNNAQPGKAVQPISEDEKLTRLGAAIDTLERNDPLIVDHLEKLATIASTKPDQFKMLVGMLDLY